MAGTKVPTHLITKQRAIVPSALRGLTIGKSNLLFNAQKIQKNPIFQISVDILSNTNFFQAFTALVNVPAIYLQQKALATTPVIPAHPFELPPSVNNVIDLLMSWAISLAWIQPSAQGQEHLFGGVMIGGTSIINNFKLHEVVGNGKEALKLREQEQAAQIPDSICPKKKRTTDQFILRHNRESIHESSSMSDSERTESEREVTAPKGDKDQDEVDTSTMTSRVSIPVSDPEKALEALAT
ncbi:hypothetical protein Tco_1548583 [Tanacetum coccineum]